MNGGIYLLTVLFIAPFTLHWYNFCTGPEVITDHLLLHCPGAEVVPDSLIVYTVTVAFVKSSCSIVVMHCERIKVHITCPDSLTC